MVIFNDKYNKFKREKMAAKLEKNNTIKQFLTINVVSWIAYMLYL